MPDVYTVFNIGTGHALARAEQHDRQPVPALPGRCKLLAPRRADRGRARFRARTHEPGGPAVEAIRKARLWAVKFFVGHSRGAGPVAHDRQ